MIASISMWFLLQGIFLVLISWLAAVAWVFVMKWFSFQISKKETNLPKNIFRWLAYPITLPPAIAMISGLFFDTKSGLVVNFLLILLLSDVIFSLYLIVKMKHYRFLIASIVVPLIFVAAVAVFVGGMTITNDWL